MKPSQVTSLKQNSRHLRPLRARKRTKQVVCGILWTALLFLGSPVKGDPSTTDSDQDGYTDEEETNGGYDPNDPTNYPGYEYTIDSDQDGHTDYVETSAGTDPNDANSYPGSTPPPSPDTDNDGHSDADESAAGTDPNDANSYPGSSSPAPLDSDGDGYPDADEFAAGTDPNDSTSYPGSSGGAPPPDPYTIDSDSDGHTDGAELDSGTDPYNSESYPTQGPDYSPDTDGDGFSDAVEGTENTDPNNPSSYPNSPYLIDSDFDGWSDGAENDALTNPNDPSSYPNAPDPYTTDTDNDGYTDYQEGVEGTDPNDPTSYPGYLNSVDSDGDGHYDADETAQGYDPLDPNSYPGMQVPPTDSDGDGYSDSDEIQAYTNPYDSSSYPGSSYDSDGDGYSDYDEGLAYTDPYDASSYPGSGSTNDTDGDGLFDYLESTYGTDINLTDTDGDGLSDGAEVSGFTITIWVDGYGYTDTVTTDPTTPDTDGDLLLDGWELQNGYLPTYAGDGLSDLDEDGLSVGQEVVLHGTNPGRFDTDEDGEGDGYELSHSTNPLDPESHTFHDSDDDGMGDEWESTHGLNPQDASDAVADGDNDLLINYREFLHRGDPANNDTDGDGYLDGFEWNHQFNPANASDAANDSDGDLMPDLWELFHGLNPGDSADQSSDLDGDQLPAHAEFAGGYNPNLADSDSDGISDYDEFYGNVVDDTDGDGLSNTDETATHQTDPNNADTDGDGLSDYAEIFGSVHSIETPDGPVGVSFTTNPTLADTDDDGMGDYFEIFNFFNPTDPVDGAEDEDGDGLANGEEHSVHLTDVFSADTDADGESDSLEIAQGTDPRNAASNNLDADGDLMRTSWEIANDLDPNDAADATGDPDGDLLVNLEEFREGTNPHAADSDADGIDDRLEIQHGFDPTDPGDAQTDTDGDTMPDLWEIVHGLSHTDGIDASDDPDGDFLTNLDEFGAGTKPNLADSDVDGLDDGVEYSTDLTGPDGKAPSTYRTNPAKKDTDDDGFLDGFELARDWHAANPVEGSLDADGDGLTNRAEILVHRTNWEVADTDNDGESDGYEIAQGTNPLDIQSRSALDTDGDHMSDAWETAHGLNPQVPDGGADPDTDGLNNHGEFLAGTHPQNPDCDGDGYFDGLERTYGKDPLSADDADDDSDSDGLPDLWEMKYGLPWQNADHESNDPEGDGVDNLTEFQHGSNPNSHESDGDGLLDSEEISGQGTTHTGIAWNYAVNPAKRDTDGDTQDDLYEILNGKDPTNPNSFVATANIPLNTGTGTDANILTPVDGSPAPTSPFWTFGVVADSDGDGVTDAQELQDGTDPHDGTLFLSPITSGVDADRDGLSDDWETVHGLDPADASQGWRDPDYDRLNNRREQSFGTPPIGTWTPLSLSGMTPDGPRSGQDPRFPTSTLATLNDFGEMARVSLESGQLLLSIFQNGAWGSPVPIPLTQAPLSVGEVLRNNFGVTAIEIRVSTSGTETVLIVVRGSDGGIRLVGEGQSWSDVTDLRLTDSGFLAGRCVGSLPAASESVFRWRKGELLVLPHPGQVKLKGLGERGQILEETLGLYENGAWNASAAGAFALGPHGGILPASSYPAPGALFPYAKYQSLSQHGEVVSGVSPVDPAEVVRGYHARVLSRGGEFIVTEDDWLRHLDEPYLNDPEIPVGGDWIAGAGANYTYVPDAYSPTYQFDFDYDDDGFWNDLETQAGVSTNDPNRFPGWDANVVVSDANRSGDFVGWIYRATTRIDPVSGLEFPANDAYLWQYRDFSYFGGADHIWVLNNTGSFIASNLVGVEAPDFATSGLHVPAHSYRLFRPAHDADGNGMADDWEAFHAVASASADLDGDGLTAREEFVFGTSPNHTDTDGDGLRDSWELRHGGDPVRRESALVADLDGDTLDWRAEATAGTDPYFADTDGDRVRDDWEVKHQRNPLSASDGLPPSGDFDHDGYTNEQEWVNGTDPFDLRSNSGLVDTDQDQMPDVWEALYGLNPNDATDAAFDSDSDGLTNAQEYENGSAPNPVWKWIPFTPLNSDSTDTSHYGHVPHFVGSLNDLGQIATAVRSGDYWSLHIWDRGQWGTAIPLGAVPGYTRVEAVRMNNFGLVAVQLRNPTTLRVRIAIRIPGEDVVWLGGDRPWQAIPDLAVTDSGFVGGNVYLAGDPVGRASFVWRKGVIQELALPSGEQFRRGLSERGEMVATDSVLRRGQWTFQTGGYPLGVGHYGNLFLNHRPSDPWDAQHAKALDKTSFLGSSGHRFISSRIAVNGPWMGELSVIGANGVPIELDFPSFIPYEGGTPLQTGTYGSDMNRKGATVGFQVAEVSGATKYAAFHWDGLSRLRSYVSSQEPFGTPFVPSDSRFYQINETGQILTWAGTTEGVWDELNQTNVTVSESHWGLRVPHTDGDHDGMADDWERFHGLNDPIADADSDGLANRVEFALGLDPTEKSSDGDKIDDDWEVAQGVDPSANNAQTVEDLDEDGLHWTTEFLAGTDPYSSDTDGDGVADDREDLDGDGLSNLAEQNIGSDPGNKDTNDDGYDDLEEITNGSNPIRKKNDNDNPAHSQLRGDLKIRRVDIANQKWGRRRLDSNFAVNGGVDDDYYLIRKVEFSCFESEIKDNPFKIHIGNGGIKSTYEFNSSEILNYSGWHVLRYEPEWRKGPGGWNLHTKLFVSGNIAGTYEYSSHSSSTRQCYSGSESESETEDDRSSFANVSETIDEIEIQPGRGEEYFSFPAPQEWVHIYKRKGCAEGSELETTQTSGTSNYYRASLGPTSGFMDSKVHEGNMPVNASGGEITENGTRKHRLIEEDGSFTHPDGTNYETELRRSVTVTLKDKYTEEMAISDGWDGLSQAEESLGEEDFHPANRSLIAHRRVDEETGKFHCSSCDYIIEWSGGIPGGTVVWFEVFQPLDPGKPYEVERFTATLDSAGTLITEERRITATDFSEDGDFYVTRPTSSRGGIISPNTGDDDGDGIPNFADGFSDLFTDNGLNVDEHPDLQNVIKEYGTLIPLASYSNLPNVPDAEEAVLFNLFGNESDPSLMTSEPHEGGDGEFGRIKLPGGSMRIWALGAGDKKRKASSILAGGDYIPPGVEIPIAKLEGKSIFLEVLRPSVEKDDLKIEALSYRGVDNYSFTSVSTDFYAVLEGGGTERLPAMASSLPSPEITVSNFQVTNTRPSPDGEGLLADLTVSGTVASAVCDITPGTEGRIDEIHAAVNSEPSPDRTVRLDVNKSTNPNDLRRPHPYSATFTRTFPDVPVVEGNNVFSLLATDPVYRLPGSASVPFTIEATPPVGVITERSLTVEFPKLGNGLDPGTVRVTHVLDGVRVIDSVVLASVTPTRYEQSGGSVVLQLGSAPTLDPTETEVISATVSDSAGGWTAEHFPLVGEFAPDSFVFGVSNGGSETVSYAGWEVEVGDIAAPESQGAGEFNPMVLKLSGPVEVLDTLEQVEIGDVKVPVVKKDGSYYLAREDDENQVATVIVTPIRPDVGDDLGQLGSSTPDWENLPEDVPEAELDAALALLERKAPDWEDLGNRIARGAHLFGSANLTDKADLKYYKGLFDGFKGNPSDTGSELWGLAKGAVKLAAKAVKYSPGLLVFKVTWEFTGGDRFDGEIKAACQFGEKVGNAAQTALSYWPQVKEFLYKLEDATGAQLAEFLATGHFPGSEKVGPAMELAMFTILNLYVSAMDWWNGLEPYKRGYYQGYVLFEVVASVAAGLLTAPAGGSGAAVVLARHAPKFGMVLKKLGTGLTKIANAAGDAMGPLRNVIDDLVARITGAKAGGWCFVAGTMIMTAQGAVPIEQIREGDLVWSAHETTGEVGLAPVMELYRNEAEEIWTVRYAPDEDGAPVRELKCTGEHPFWSETEQAFVPAAELEPGGELRLFGGESARVVNVTPRRGPTGGMTTIYNFAVADHHTYFAGEDGVWVHNRNCYPAVELAISDLQAIMSSGKSYEEASEIVLEALATEYRTGGKLNREQLFDAATAVIEHENNPVWSGGVNVVHELSEFRRKLEINPFAPGDESDGVTIALARITGEQKPAFGINSDWNSNSEVHGFNVLRRNLRDRVGLPPGANESTFFHAEALSLIRLEERLGDAGSLAGKRLALDVDRPPCPHCLPFENGQFKTGEGLAAIAQTMGLDELIVHCPNGIRDLFGNTIPGITKVKIDAQGVVTPIP